MSSPTEARVERVLSVYQKVAGQGAVTWFSTDPLDSRLLAHCAALEAEARQAAVETRRNHSARILKPEFAAPGSSSTE